MDEMEWNAPRKEVEESQVFVPSSQLLVLGTYPVYSSAVQVWRLGLGLRMAAVSNSAGVQVMVELHGATPVKLAAHCGRSWP